MNTDFSQNLWYQGKELAKAGTMMLGWITSVKSEGGGGIYQVRCPAIHGYCDINEANCEEDVVAKDALPWIPTIATEHGNSAIGANNDTRQYAKGQFVVVKFDGPNYSSPTIVSAHKAKHPVLGTKENFDQSRPYVIASLVKPLEQNFSTTQGDNGCFSVVVDADKIPENGENKKSADKCGDSGSISSDIGAFIGDFLKIVQNTDGKIGSKFVSSVTGELFEITGYIQKYMAAISGILRSGLGWVKAIITKYARKAIDQLVKLIMTPIKGITSTINQVIEQILNMVFCSFGNIEAMISNMIEDLLNTLVDSALNSVFGCLNTLVDGILNEIMGEVLGLVESIMGAIESVAGIIGGFGNLLGEAINAVLDFLGISCGGAGDCATSASNALVTTFNNPGEFGLTSGITGALQGGLDGINTLTSDITKSTAEANAEAAAYAKGVDMGTANVPGVSTDNAALKKAFTTANNMAASAVSDVFDFCNNLSAGNNGNGSSTTPTNPGDDGPYTPSTTYAVVIGKEEDKYDAEYSIFPVKESVESGKTQKVKIRRNNSHEDGVIIFAVHLRSTDTARVVGITEGLTAGGDLEKGTIIGDKQYAQMPKKSNSKQEFPKKKRVIKSEKLFFPAGTSEIITAIPTLVNEPPKDDEGFQNAEEVTYTASIYRSSDDLDKDKYPFKNLPHTSGLLNSTKLAIRFAKIPGSDPVTTDIFLPPEILTSTVNYSINNVSVIAGQAAQFQVIRNPVVDYTTKVKCTTVTNPGDAAPATEGVHYTGGSGILTFGPGENKKIFSVPTLEVATLTNTTKSFDVTFVDNKLPVGVGSNLFGKGTEAGTQVGGGITRTAIINYSPTFKPSPICQAEVLITSANPPCVVQEEDVPLNISVIPKTSVPGYVFSYEWQRSLDPDATNWTTVNNGVRTETVSEKVTTWGPSDVTISGTTLDAWETTDVNQSVSINYTGATTNTLTVDEPSYLILDQEYYRCVITATPITPSKFTPTLTYTTEPTYVGITKEGVFSSTVNCAPPGTLQDGSLVTYTSAPSIAGGGESFELFENYKPTLTSENVPGDKLTAKFLADGSGIKVSGKGNGGQGSIKLRFEWDDNVKTSGQSVGQLFVAGKKFSQGNKEKGITTKTIYVEAGKTYKFQYKTAKNPAKQRGTKVIADGQIILWDDDAGNSFDENARLSILKVTGKESSIITKKVNNFTAGFYPKSIGQYAQHTYGSDLNWANLQSSYEGDFTLNGGSGTGLQVKARFEALAGIGGNPHNTKYTILAILNPGENYVVGDELSFPDQGGYTFSQMGDLVRILNPDFGIDDDAGLCEVVEPTQDVPEDVIPDDPDPDPIPDDPDPEVNPPTPDPEDIDLPVVPTSDPDDDDDSPPPSTPVIIGPPGGVVSVPIPPGLPKYKQPPLIPITGPGTGAVAKAELDADGNLIDIVVKSPGIGYTPSVFDQCGILSNIVITNAGGYFNSSPTVYVNNDPTVAVAAIEDGRLAEIRIVNPQNKVYNTIPDIRIQGDGFGGSAKAVIRFVPCPNVPDEYLNVVNKYNDSKLGTVFVVDCP